MTLAIFIWEAEDSFQIHWFNEHIRPHLKGFLNDNQRPIKVHLVSKKKGPSPRETGQTLSFLPDPLDPEMTLERFISHESNLVAYKLASDLTFNPIYLYGPKGVGKTHLLMGAAHTLQKKGGRLGRWDRSAT